MAVVVVIQYGHAAQEQLSFIYDKNGEYSVSLVIVSVAFLFGCFNRVQLSVYHLRL